MKYQANGAALPVEVLLRPIKMGKRLKVVFIDYHERIGQTTMRPLQSAWWTLKRILMVRVFRDGFHGGLFATAKPPGSTAAPHETSATRIQS